MTRHPRTQQLLSGRGCKGCNYDEFSRISWADNNLLFSKGSLPAESWNVTGVINSWFWGRRSKDILIRILLTDKIRN